ncbi:MAG: protein-export chaperone SecB [Rhodospirillales bacterium]
MARKTRSTSKKQDDKTKTEAATDAPETAAADSKTPATPATAETASPATGDAAQPMLVINGQYIKDLSFEVPNAPAVFTQTGTPPEIPINIDVKARNVQANVFEVVIDIRIDAKIKNDPAFILELSYGGVFTINVPKENLQPVLLIECPRLMFPYARNIVSDITRDGGFAPLMLSPIDFAQLYRQRMQQAAEAKS